MNNIGFVCVYVHECKPAFLTRAVDSVHRSASHISTSKKWLSADPAVLEITAESSYLTCLTLVTLTQIYPAFANSVDPDQLAPEEAN